MNCYIAEQGSFYNLPEGIDKDNTLFYPESGMTTRQMFHTSRPRDYHIITDCPYLVSLYSLYDVFIWEDGEWVNPDFQTYGCSYNIIKARLWEYNCSIPAAVIGGIELTNCMGHRRTLIS